VAKRDLEFGTNVGQGAAQLVGGIGDERPLPRRCGLEPAEHVVEGGREPADLVVCPWIRQASRLLRATDLGRAATQCFDRAECRADDEPAQHGEGCSGDDSADRDRAAHQRDRALLIGDRNRDENRLRIR
jgi:hypothetical protein